MGFLTLIGGVKGVVVILLVAALGGYIWKIKHDASAAEATLVTVTAQRDAAAAATATAVEANKTTQATIDQLKLEKEDVQNSLNNLDAARALDQVVITKLRKGISSQSKNPANQATLSPVLADTIAQIQNARVLRAAQAASGVAK